MIFGIAFYILEGGIFYFYSGVGINMGTISLLFAVILIFNKTLQSNRRVEMLITRFKVNLLFLKYNFK